MDADVRAAFEDLTALIESTSQSLQSEMQTPFEGLEAATGEIALLPRNGIHATAFPAMIVSADRPTGFPVHHRTP
jgi:hypothetical protein